MDETRTRSRLVPVLGGVTAAATAAGGVAVAHVAPAGAEPAADVALNLAAPAQDGTFESCSAYFGFGKEIGVLGLVEFDVADVNGDDGADHGVDLDGDGDTDVLLVMENEEGDVLECVPFEVTEDQWDDEFGEDPQGQLPPHPGPGHYVYPSVALEPEIEDFGIVAAVGFRVTDIPAEHTLVSPEGVKGLVDHFLNPEALFFSEVIDSRVLDLIEAEAGADARDAFEAALDCENNEFPQPPAFDDAIAVLQALTGDDDEDIGCFDVRDLHLFSSMTLGVLDAVDYIEPIRLRVPETPTPGETPTTQPPAGPATSPAAQPVTAQPTFTG